MTHKTKNHLYISLFFGAFFTYLIMVFFNLKDFHIWEQIEELHQAGLPLNFTTIYTHPHGMRFMLISPIYLIADLSHVSPNKIFSLLAVTMCMTISIALANSIALFQKLKNQWELRFFIFLFFAILSLSMNGRLIFGLFAYSMLSYGILLFVKEKETKEKNNFFSLVLITLATLFSSISSGVAISLFIICFSSIFGILLYFYWKGSKCSLIVIGYMFTLCLLNAPLISVLINKNISYFGDGADAVLSMTQHGTLSKLTTDQNIFFKTIENIFFKTICLGFICLLISFIYIHRTNFINNPMRLFIAYCMGLLILLSSFAYSILIMAFIPAIIMLVLISGKISSVIGSRFFEDYHASSYKNT